MFGGERGKVAVPPGPCSPDPCLPPVDHGLDSRPNVHNYFYRSPSRLQAFKMEFYSIQPSGHGPLFPCRHVHPAAAFCTVVSALPRRSRAIWALRPTAKNRLRTGSFHRLIILVALVIRGSLASQLPFRLCRPFG